MTIKQQGGIFGRNPTFNDVEASSIEIDTTTGNSTIAQLALWDNSQSEQAYLRLAHSLGTSKGSHTAITVNDALGGVRFAGSTGTAFYDGASVEGKATQTYTASNGGTKLLFKTTPNTTQTLTEQMSLDQDGTLTVANGNIVIGTSGKGIDFSATSDAAGSTSELFDDYEEGTWTPTFELYAGTPTNVSGAYTKVGNLVFIHLSATFDGTSDPSTLRIKGAPFNSANSCGLSFAVNTGASCTVEILGGNIEFKNSSGADLSYNGYGVSAAFELSGVYYVS